MTDKMPDDQLYGHTNARELEPHFMNHLMAMTSENLHSKSDIACELAYRDMLIQKHAEEIAALKAEHREEMAGLCEEIECLSLGAEYGPDSGYYKGCERAYNDALDEAIELIKQRISDE